LEKVEDREIELAHSDRSKTPIEPYLADQWFVKMDELAQSAMDAVSDGRVKITPARFARGYLDWLGEKRDWPVSRQLWWGHRIPIWYAPTASEDDLKRAFAGRSDVVWSRDPEHDQWLISAEEADLAEDAVPGHKIRQEVDVLDTWFSSALWPHSTLGWPEKTPELAYYYPTSTLVTNRDILTLWVARMVLTGLFNMHDVPFRDVYIHPTILDSYGERMSKSKGNGVDPIDVIERVGADSLRFSLTYLTTETQDVRMPVEFECPHCGALIEQTKKNRVQPRIDCKKCHQSFSTQWASKPVDTALARGAMVSERFELGRNFCNKLWNASRFALLNLDGYEPALVADDELAVEDRWLLSRLATVTAETTAALEAFRYADAARLLYDFAWNEFCSFYVEMVKSRLQDAQARATAQRVLAAALDTLLRLLHPIVPFITEEVWQLLNQAAPARGLQRLEEPAESVVVADWPQADSARRDERIEAQFAQFQLLLGGLREVRSRQNIPPKTPLKFSVRATHDVVERLQPMEPYFAAMAGAQASAWGPTMTSPATATSFVAGEAEVFVDLAEHIDVDAEIARKTKEIAKLDGAIAGKERQLSNANFVARAPAEVIEKERAALTQLQELRDATRASLAVLQSSRK
jgi:valyl-tRNA synthetase